MNTGKKPERPIRVLQFGGGVFLRGFFDWMLQKANDTGVFCGDAVIVRSRTTGTDPLAAAQFRYTHIAKDASHEDVTPVNCIAGSVCPAEDFDAFLSLAENPDTDVIVSNTTERGIEYRPCPFSPAVCPPTFPAKLTHWLYRRYRTVGKGVLILPLELIGGNGDALKAAVLAHARDFALGADFLAWAERECSFRNTLVDRIVSGAPEGDMTRNQSEYFHLFVIEGEPDPRLPFAKVGVNIRWVPSVTPYRDLKVRILNGAHTSLIPYAMTLGVGTVRECLQNRNLRAHLARCLDEIVTSLDTDPAEARAYADSVLERFANPYIEHRCAAIALSSISKFRVRVVPSLLAYREKTGQDPQGLLQALVKLLEFYKTGLPEDDPGDIRKVRELPLPALLADRALWGADLSVFSKEVERLADS